jgi:cyclopropane fatty-acyl-phospholipid synthase-like methyltransferase
MPVPLSTGSRKNIEEHYDAGNAMYATFLDESMTYSAGIHTQVRSVQSLRSWSNILTA